MKWLECLILQQNRQKSSSNKRMGKQIKPPRIQKKYQDKFGVFIIWICIILAVCYAVYFVSCKFFISTVEITGHSMQQTIFDGDKVVLNNQDYEPKQGDIVVIAENGTQLDTAIIKRELLQLLDKL